MDKQTVMERIAQSGVVPVAVIEHLEHAVPLARAMLLGGVDVIEVTFRTEAAPEAIRAISENCPDMLVGAGTVVRVEQCEQAVDCGAQFIVCPGFSRRVVQWCVEHEVPVVPGCVTPSEIMEAMDMGLEVLKFFPSNIYGGLAAMKALSGPFPGIRFIPTSGINMDNAGDFLRAPFIYAVGGSWACPRGEISAGNFRKISELCRETRKRLLGFEIVHMGMNCDTPDTARALCLQLQDAFDFAYKPGGSDFASDFVEVKKGDGRGTYGHIAIGTNSIPAAIAEMKKRGYALDEDSGYYENGVLTAIYLRDEIGGYAFHLMQKK